MMRMSGNITTKPPAEEEDAGTEYSEVGENIYSSLRRESGPNASARGSARKCPLYSDML